LSIDEEPPAFVLNTEERIVDTTEVEIESAVQYQVDGQLKGVAW
jgi:hypothetical protein